MASSRSSTPADAVGRALAAWVATLRDDAPVALALSGGRDSMLLLDAGRVVADGAPTEVLTEALIAAHYGAAIDVVAVGERIAVVPRRTGRVEP